MPNIKKQISQLKTGEELNQWIIKSSPKLLISQSFLRKILLKLVKKYTYKSLLSDKKFPYQVQLDKFYMGQALAKAVNKLLEQAKTHRTYRQAIESVLPAILGVMREGPQKAKAFKEKYGFNPPGFLTISPTEFCNLKCIGCYANSSAAASAKLDWDVVDRIITEKTKDWGSWFTVISGGEPLLWKSQGKTIIDIAKKHPDNFFLMYTNGTLIDKRMAQKLAEVGNITPAISVEGFEKETDERRGKGVHQRILKAMGNLKEVGVPFGISLTATRKNAEMITSEKLIKYYWDKGAIYAWIFQLMPIGRASFDLVVTPEQRLKMFRQTQKLIRKGYFMADFWNCGMISNGCISAGKTTGGGYLYIEWNGNITPCVFNPYAAANINEIYQRNGSLNEVLITPFFQRIKRWQEDYGLGKEPDQIQNWILPCPIRDHYKKMREFIDKDKPQPIDESAKQALQDKEYAEKMINYDKALTEIFDPIWEEEYKSRKRVEK